jgi:hypothetical protein
MNAIAAFWLGMFGGVFLTVLVFLTWTTLVYLPAIVKAGKERSEIIRDQAATIFPPHHYMPRVELSCMWPIDKEGKPCGMPCPQTGPDTGLCSLCAPKMREAVAAVEDVRTCDTADWNVCNKKECEIHHPKEERKQP